MLFNLHLLLLPIGAAAPSAREDDPGLRDDAHAHLLLDSHSHRASVSAERKPGARGAASERREKRQARNLRNRPTA